MPSGREISEDPSGGGARARPSLQAFLTQYHLTLHGASLPNRCGGRAILKAGRETEVDGARQKLLQGPSHGTAVEPYP